MAGGELLLANPVAHVYRHNSARTLYGEKATPATCHLSTPHPSL